MSRAAPIAIIRTEKPGVVLVQSSRDPGTHYIITNFGTPFAMCDCPGAMTHSACKHLSAALDLTAKEMKEPMPEEITKAVAVATRSSAVLRAEQARLQVQEHMAGWAQMKILAAEHIKSGFAPAEVKSPEAGALIIQKAIELDIPITSAYAYIDIIKGRPALRGQMIGALVQRSGKGTITITQTSAMECTAEGRRDGRVCAITCKITDFKLDTDTWRKYPADMLRHKAVARVGRFMFPDVLAGMEASDGGGAVVDSMYSVEDAAIGRVEVEREVIPGEPPAPEAAPLEADWHEAPEAREMPMDEPPPSDDEALFQEFLDALNDNHATPGALSLAMRDAIGSGQWCPENAIEWTRKSGKRPTDLVLGALAMRKAS